MSSEVTKFTVHQNINFYQNLPGYWRQWHWVPEANLASLGTSEVPQEGHFLAFPASPQHGSGTWTSHFLGRIRGCLSQAIEYGNIWNYMEIYHPQPQLYIHPRSSHLVRLHGPDRSPTAFLANFPNICTSSKVDFHKVWPSSQQVSPWAQTPLKENPFQVNSREMFIILSAHWLPQRCSKQIKQQIMFIEFIVYFFGGLRPKLPTITMSLSAFLGYIYLEPKWPLFLKVTHWPPKTRPFPIKTRVIWVPGIYMMWPWTHSKTQTTQPSHHLPLAFLTCGTHRRLSWGPHSFFSPRKYKTYKN